MSRIYAIILCLGAFVISTDQWGKYLALEKLQYEGQSITFLDGWFSWTLVHNHGAAFGVLRNLPDSVRVGFFIAMPLAVLGILWWSLVRHYKPGQVLAPIAMGLVLGGAIGNFIDRLRFGFVIDFIDWFYPSANGKCIPLFAYQDGSGCHWPVFNIADSAISLAVVLLAIESLRNPSEPSQKT
ncbi:MAG: signal peptidase II [Bdellovibrionota bacterium]